MRQTAVTLVPHTHWDREWYAPFSEFSERLVAMMDTLLELADGGFPHFHLDGQTAMIDDYLDRRPERAGDVARHVREGRLSAGPWFTQMDEFLASGESHIRNLQRGLARGRELGRVLDTGYMPDQFGHIGQMPQILRAAGLRRAVVWRGVPRFIDKDAFWWEAPDASRVLAEYMVFGYFNGAGLEAIEDDGDLADALRQAVERQRPFTTGDAILVMVGYDHSGPDRRFPERLERARPSLAGVEARVEGIGAHDPLRKNSELPVWRGELRSSARAHLLPNVVSARVHQKRERGRVEALVERYAEPLAALVPGFPWPGEDLDRIWRLLLWNGAHDSACGCSHDQVALDVDARFTEARTRAERIRREALEALASLVSRSGRMRWNPSPFQRDGVPALGWNVDDAKPDVAGVPVPIKPVSRESIAAGGVELRLLDEPDVGDLYNFCPDVHNPSGRPPAELEVSGNALTATFGDDLVVHLRITRRPDEPMLRLEGSVVNGRRDHRLRLHVGLQHEAAGSIAGSPFELESRPIRGEGSDLETPSSTWPARGVVLAGGTAVFSEGVFEYEAADAELAVTILRCVGTISRPSLATRPSAAGPDVPTPLAQMAGETPFLLGVRPRAELDTILADYERFALPLAACSASGGGTLPERGSLLEIGGDVQLSNVRKNDGRVEVRVWNQHGDAPTTATIDGRELTLGPARIETVALSS